MANPKTSLKLTKEIQQKQDHQTKKPEKPTSWLQVRGFFSSSSSSKFIQSHQDEQKQQPTLPPKQQQQKHHPKQKPDPRKTKKKQHHQVDVALEETSKRCKKMRCSGSICSNTKVMHRPETTITPTKMATSVSPETLQRKRAASSSSLVSSTRSSSKMGSSSHSSSSRSMKGGSSSFNELSNMSSSNNNSNNNNNLGYGVGAFKGMPFRKLSGCYECRMVVDPVLAITRDPSMRGTICSCPDCGEIFMKPESLELHQAVRHAVSELGPKDTSKNIVEIIFQSSWLKKQTPICKIDRILKVHNTQRTISKFEEYRDSIKAKSTKRHPRCVADGNELLRFYCTTLSCSLGLDGSSNLCGSIPKCNICNVIKNGFAAGSGQHGILTTATSGRAHDNAAVPDDGDGGNKRAMLVCRVIAGRVKKDKVGDGSPQEQEEECDSVAGDSEVYSNLDELFVFNPKAILPCFVVIYRGF